jgi:hypothetical protein
MILLKCPHWTRYFCFLGQALWQETVASVPLGTLAQSSLLEDESRAQLNAQLTAAVKANRWPIINLLEVTCPFDICFVVLRPLTLVALGRQVWLGLFILSFVRASRWAHIRFLNVFSDIRSTMYATVGLRFSVPFRTGGARTAEHRPFPGRLKHDSPPM